MPEELTPEVGNDSVANDLGTAEQVESTDSTTSTTDLTDGPRFTVMVDGQDVEVTEAELKASYLRQQDYTKKTQNLASEKQRLAFAERIYDGLQADPAATLEFLRSELIGDEPDEVEELDPIERLEREIDNIKAARQNDLSLAEISRTVAQLKQAHGAFDENELFQFAIDHKIPSLEDALVLQRALSAASGTRPGGTPKDELPPIAGGSSTSGSTGPKSNPFPTVKEALMEALREHGVKSISDALPHNL